MAILQDNFINKIVNKIKNALSLKQDTLVSGSNIKTINGESILGSGNLNLDSKHKGYFTTVESLTQKYPISTIGSIAFVGYTYPYAIYEWTDSGWVDTGAIGGDVEVNLNDYYTKDEIHAREVLLTEDEYNALDEIDDTKIYYIYEEE